MGNIAARQVLGYSREGSGSATAARQRQACGMRQQARHRGMARVIGIGSELRTNKGNNQERELEGRWCVQAVCSWQAWGRVGR